MRGTDQTDRERRRSQLRSTKLKQLLYYVRAELTFAGNAVNAAASFPKRLYMLRGRRSLSCLIHIAGAG